VIAALKRIGFCSFLSVEPHLNNNLPGGGPENFAKAYRAIKRIIDEEGEI